MPGFGYIEVDDDVCHDSCCNGEYDEDEDYYDDDDEYEEDEVDDEALDESDRW